MYGSVYIKMATSNELSNATKPLTEFHATSGHLQKKCSVKGKARDTQKKSFGGPVRSKMNVLPAVFALQAFTSSPSWLESSFVESS